MKQSDLDKLEELRAKADMPRVMKFSPDSLNGWNTMYMLVPEFGKVPGIGIEICEPVPGFGDLEKQKTRAEYVALVCNIAPALAKSNAAMIAIMRDAIERAIEAQEEWADVELPYAPEWVYPLRQIVNLLTNAVAQAEGESS
jgi:hypothetical protein